MTLPRSSKELPGSIASLSDAISDFFGPRTHRIFVAAKMLVLKSNGNRGAIRQIIDDFEFGTTNISFLVAH